MGVLNKLFPGTQEYPKNSAGKNIALGFQHAFAMSCATILVPLLTGSGRRRRTVCRGRRHTDLPLVHRRADADISRQLIRLYCGDLGVVGNSDFGATKEEQIAAAMAA